MICYFDKPAIYHWSGLFESPSADWIHMSRELTDYEFFLVTKGTLYIEDHRGRYGIHKGEYFIMEKTSRQQGYKPSDCSFYWLHFELPSVKSPMELADNQAYDIPIRQTIEYPDRLIVLLHQLQDSARRYQNPLTSNYLLTSILLELYHQTQSPREQKADVHTYHERLCTSITDYISYHPMDNITVSSLADFFGYHEKYVSSLFKKQMGIGLKQYILQEKMEHAKVLLMETDQTILQIGNSLGFPCGHHFSKAFKKVTGLPPKSYRNNCLKVPKNP